MPRQGEIVLIPVPFTDLSSQKRRPVIVISNDSYNSHNRDMVVVAMTSNPAPAPNSFVINSSDLKAGQLNHPGTVRADKIFSLEQSLVVKTFGEVHQSITERIRKTISSLLEPS